MTKMIKNSSVGNLTTKIQALTIISTYIVNYLINSETVTMRQLFGIMLMLSGIIVIDR